MLSFPLDFIRKEVKRKGVWNGYQESQPFCITRMKMNKNSSLLLRAKERVAQGNVRCSSERQVHLKDSHFYSGTIILTY